jgi:hypothetical protein
LSPASLTPVVAAAVGKKPKARRASPRSRG